jgi:cyclase
MLKKRIIPCLDIKAGRTVKGIRFVSLRDAGDPVELAAAYAAQGADELVFLDITASRERRRTLIPLVVRIAAEINIPFTVGGGVSSVDDAARLLDSGADKVTINTAAVVRPRLIEEIAGRYGSQCVVVAIDAKPAAEHWEVMIEGGQKATGKCVQDWAKEVELAGAGEILLTSMAADGCKKGFSLDMTASISASVNVPVIASGGAGAAEHFCDLFTQTRASAGLAASVFHFGELTIPALKTFLRTKNIPVR